MVRIPTLSWFSVSWFFVLGCFTVASADELTYEQNIRPIFREHCFDCHGATDEMEGGLDLRLVRFMKQGGDSGASLVVGKPDESYLLQRIEDGDMPPGESTVPAEQIEIIQRWIAGGAKTVRPEPETLGPGLGITQEERSFWSFQPIERPEVPSTDSPMVRNAIDNLVLANDPDAIGTEANRRTLILRASFDLLGLPPSPDELARWVETEDPNWFAHLIDELLQSPHYGERWARHWLDVAGYADSEGYTVADSERAWAWKYRDWVIAALNDDKPFDRFVTEQLAGDELAGERQGDLTPEQIDLLTATGFLRMAADGTAQDNSPEARNRVMVDTLKIVGTTMLAMSLQCAQCHDHRYDPIPQTDYYALRAVFEPALDWRAWKSPAARRVSLYSQAEREQAAKIEAEVAVVAKERGERLAEFMKQAIDQELEKFDPPLRSQLREAYETPAKKRNKKQKELLSAHPSVNITTGNLYQYIPESRPKLAEFDNKIAEIQSRKPAEEFIRALVEPAGHVPETKLFHRGDHQQPKQTVLPAALSVAVPEGESLQFPVNEQSLPSTGRRLAFAKWLTSRNNPLLARVIVNRVWMHHFGKGLVATPADFGKLGARPDNLRLLDWLASEFIDQGWSLKRLHRLIMTSAAYRQAAGAGRPLRRLEAEVIRDRMLAAAGVLESELFGRPVAIKDNDAGQTIVDGQQTRRSLYIQVRRSQPVAMLKSFDAPVMETNCEIRNHSTVSPQSLMLLNGEFVLNCAAKLADRAAAESQAFSAEHAGKLESVLSKLDGGWRYGHGTYDAKEDRVVTFAPLTHWTGSQWQGGESLPDPKTGWALVNAAGGHPDSGDRSVIRRWIAPASGTARISGTLRHGSENGDGVLGRVVSNRGGQAGEWTVQHGQTATEVATLEVQEGDAVDFVVECRAHNTSDSFTWPVTITLEGQTFSSAEQFAGPVASADVISGQIVHAWQLAYGRMPSKEELRLAIEFVDRQLRTMQSRPSAVPSGRSKIRQAMTNLCQSLLSSNEFLYVE
jgi:hypothetical protein